MAGATLGDVARRAGVSKGTASKVFNNRPDVSESTRKRVREAARDLGYLSGRDPGERRVGVPRVFTVFHTLANAYSSTVAEGLIGEAATARALITITQTGGMDADPLPGTAAWMRESVEQGAQAFVLVATPVTPAHVAVSAASGAPLILVDPLTPAPAGATTVSATNWRGGMQATEHLISLGHTRIAFVGAQPESLAGSERLAGYRSAMARAGLPVPPHWIVPGHFVAEDGLACGPLLTGRDAPTAVFAGSDPVAMGVIEAARQVGMRVPDDLSVVGFDDSQASMNMISRLTTVHQPLAEIGATALRMAMTRLQDPGASPSPVELATRLVVRDSTAPVPSSGMRPATRLRRAH